MIDSDVAGQAIIVDIQAFSHDTLRYNLFDGEWEAESRDHGAPPLLSRYMSSGLIEWMKAS